MWRYCLKETFRYNILSTLSTDRSEFIHTQCVCKTGLKQVLSVVVVVVIFFNNLFTVPFAINYSKRRLFLYKIMKCQKITHLFHFSSKINYLMCISKSTIRNAKYWLGFLYVLQYQNCGNDKMPTILYIN